MAKQWNIPPRCPVCGGNYEITQLECTGCHSRLEGHFGAGRFDRLLPEQLRFIEAFLSCRGNIREVEKELGISYPTVRARLDEALTALGLAQRKTEEKNADILEALSRGEITVDEAMKRMKPGKAAQNGQGGQEA
ncbi:MAG: DUF2089 domain-containing protein [Eubacteriales bacterium]|nr:DUF2089 domain-containing protein [Eubacteriales bacterium]